ncbi:aspartate carbamoyltransferase catalytic subunit [Silanimonas lenta]|uniref:aspartate carbamoyltransferase catalytic subunit n=1 Tax=Silanimonas lenta TaxID=265429 RepID=UPI000414620D|nr:aspartate carbamoyltransferase catalytic subunit [Silanimonas lenta]
MTLPRLRHLLTLDGLGEARLHALLDEAEAMLPHARGGTALRQVLAGRTVCNLFFENSTRTRSSFQLAAQRLGADVLNFDVGASSVKKGETALDTFRTLEAMGVEAFVVRHAEDGAVAALADAAGPGTALLNAGDGRSNHPTQGLLDMLTLRRHKGRDFSRLSVLVVGDVKHSRVARSDLQALRQLGCRDLRVCGPAALLPGPEVLEGCTVGQELDAMLEGVDVLMMLRLQRERMEEGLVPSLEAYFADYGLDARRLARAKPDAIVMHPGPMNRGVEIAAEVADGPRSVILEQVANGVAVRMAVLSHLLGA